MAYYTILQNAWTSVTQPPAGVIGTGLTSTMTTDQKLTAVNGWIVSGVIPSTFFVTGDQVANCINFTEFNALTSTKQIQILTLCGMPGQLLGGSANTTRIVPGMFIANFTAGSQTIAQLTALAKAATTFWWQSNGYPSPFNQADATLAGLT